MYILLQYYAVCLYKTIALCIKTWFQHLKSTLKHLEKFVVGLKGTVFWF